ncbi:hypothetical protein Tco_0206904 [Tanacetum coccineum]
MSEPSYKSKLSNSSSVSKDEEEVSDDEEMTHVKVLMALADDELTVGKNHARNGEWIDITMRKVNILLSMDEDSDWQTYLKYINIDLKFDEEQRLNLLSKYNKIVFELNKCKEDLLIFKQAKHDAPIFQIQNTKLTMLNHALQEQLKEERKVERHNPESKLLTFNTGKILVTKSQAINECIKLTKAPTEPESFVESGSVPLTPLLPLKNLQGALPRSEVMPLTYQDHFPRKRPSLGSMKHTKPETQESSSKSVSRHVIVYDTKPVTSSVPTEPKSSKSVNLSKMSQESKPNGKDTDSSKSGRPKPLQKPKLKCELSESSQSKESSVGVSCTTCGSNVHSTTEHNDFFHFKRAEKIKATKAREPRKRYTWVHFLKKKSRAAEKIMSFIRMVENQNDVKVKQIRTAERKNITLIEAARTMLNGIILSKHFWTEAMCNGFLRLKEAC